MVGGAFSHGFTPDGAAAFTRLAGGADQGGADLPVADGFDMHGEFGTGWWIVMMLGMILFWGLVIAAIVWVVRELTHSRAANAASEIPIAVLDRRLASGDHSRGVPRAQGAVGRAAFRRPHPSGP